MHRNADSETRCIRSDWRRPLCRCRNGSAARYHLSLDGSAQKIWSHLPLRGFSEWTESRSSDPYLPEFFATQSAHKLCHRSDEFGIGTVNEPGGVEFVPYRGSQKAARPVLEQRYALRKFPT